MGIFKPSRAAHAHCHVPCGIYDPTFAINAAETVAKMVDQLLAMEVPVGDAPDAEKIKFHHDLERRVANKEDHARKCKYELLDVLWTQYFKPEHLERWPDLHEKFHRAGHLCTQNMQNIDAGLAQELWDLTREIGEIFAAASG